MKKISLAGLILGMIVGALAAMLSGSWIFWLGAGLAIGMLLGAAQARIGASGHRAIGSSGRSGYRRIGGHSSRGGAPPPVGWGRPVIRRTGVPRSQVSDPTKGR